MLSSTVTVTVNQGSVPHSLSLYNWGWVGGNWFTSCVFTVRNRTVLCVLTTVLLLLGQYSFPESGKHMDSIGGNSESANSVSCQFKRVRGRFGSSGEIKVKGQKSKENSICIELYSYL